MQKIDKTVEKRSGISRRTFMKGAAVGAAGLAVASTVFGGTAMAASAATITVNKSACTVTVNGAAKNFEAYLINSNNYLKLRDIAATLNGTNKQFSVSYDAATKAVAMVSGQAYAAVGGEMTALAASASAQLTPCSIKLDGKVIDATAYLIGGNNFFKLRDIMEALDVFVGYDQASKNVTLDTSKPYAAETPVVVVPVPGTSSSTSKRPISTHGSSKDGIYVAGENITKKEYDLPFVEMVQMVAVFDGEVKNDAIWRTSCKKLVSVTHDGKVTQRDGVGYNSVELSAEWDGVTYTTTLKTTAGGGARVINTDPAISRGNFMILLNNYFGWKHYNGYYDDARDIDYEGNVLNSYRVRTFYDVNGDLEYVKPIENAIDAEVLAPKSIKDKFYPDDDLTREEACLFIYRAFRMEPLPVDYLNAFDDVDDISDREHRVAMNTLIGRHFFQGRTAFTLEPQRAITETEVQTIISDIKDRVVAPVWTLPKTLQRLARSRTNYFCPTDNVTIKYQIRSRKATFDDCNRSIKVNGQTVYVTDGSWSDPITFIPGWTEEVQYGLTGVKTHPEEDINVVYDFKMWAEDYDPERGLETSPVTYTTLKFYCPPWKEPVTDVLHQKSKGFPLVVRFFDNFQSCAYYIEGSERGLLFDGLSMGNGSHGTANLYKTVKEQFATKPFSFMLGHNHGDHSGALKDCYAAGLTCMLADRVGPYYTANPAPGRAPAVDGVGYFSNPDIVKIVKEGDIVDLGDVKLEVYQQPGHMDDNLIVFDRANGLCFVSDIGGVNRYWPGDNFGCSGVRQDLEMSLQQQLVAAWTKNGSVVKEYYTGHNRIGVSNDYMMAWEQCLQRLCNVGNMFGLVHNHRGNGSMVAMYGDRYQSINWQAFTEQGKLVVNEYTSELSHSKQRLLELDYDNTFAKNLCYDFRTNAHLSNLTIKDAELIGHKFWYKWATDEFAGPINDSWNAPINANVYTEGPFATPAANDERPKYVLENKFFPDDTLENNKCYYVLIKAGQSKVTFTPTAMSDMIKGMTVNDAPAASRCPVTVSTGSDCTIKITGPDGRTVCTYLLKFVTSTTGIDLDADGALMMP